MDLNSNDSYEEEFDSSDIPGKQSIFPSRNQIIIGLLFSTVILIFIEKISIRIFLFFIPSYFFLIFFWIILHLLFLRYLIYTFIYPGKNFLVNFYLRSVFGKMRAKSFNYSLELFQNRIDKILQSNKNIENNNKIIISISNTQINKSKVSSKYVDIYEQIKQHFGELNFYEKNFLEKLQEFKTSIENSSLQENFKKYYHKENIFISEKDVKDYENIKNNAKQIQKLLNEYRGDFNEFGFSNIFKYIQNFFYNDILSSKKFIRTNALITKPLSQEFIIKTKDDFDLDCLLIYSNQKNQKICSKNLVIVCGPNLTPFENLINSWDIDNLYLMNDIDILFWNYRGYGFSEGNADFNNVCDDILDIYDFIMEHFHYNKIAVHGLSIGGIPACHLACKRNINLIIADRTFGSVDDVINTFPFGNKFINFLAKILFFPFVNNTDNFIQSNCKKILMNDPEDKTIIDTFSLKTSIAKKIIQELFLVKNPKLNIRNINSENILDYALEPEQSKEIFTAFKYTINFLKNKSINETGNNQEMIFLEKTNVNSNNYFADEKVQKLTDNSNNNNILNNINNTENNVIQISLKDISDTFYSKIKSLYSKFNSAGDSLYRFTEYMNIQSHFNNFFNNLFVYGSEDTNMLDYSLCNIHCVDEMLNNFIKESENFLNSEKIRAYSDYHIYKNFSFFVESIKNLKIFILSINLENIEREWFFELKGKLIPLNCGHILFYDEKELDTFKFLIKEDLIDYDIIVPSIEKSI
jgi:hypothetical protein